MRRFRRNPDPVYDESYKKMVKKGGFKVKFTLKPKDGEFTSEIEGIVGKSCQKVVENVTSEMGMVLSAEPTEEYFEQPKEETKAKVLPPSSTIEAPIQMPFKRKESKKTEIEKEKEKQQRRRLRRAKRNPRLLRRIRRNPYSYIDPWFRYRRF